MFSLGDKKYTNVVIQGDKSTEPVGICCHWEMKLQNQPMQASNGGVKSTEPANHEKIERKNTISDGCSKVVLYMDWIGLDLSVRGEV